MKKYILMIEWNGSDNIYQILLRRNFMVNQGNGFNGIERTNNKRRQRMLYSKVLVYKTYYANILFALRAYNHIMWQTIWGTFGVPA